MITTIATGKVFHFCLFEVIQKDYAPLVVFVWSGEIVLLTKVRDNVELLTGMRHGWPCTGNELSSAAVYMVCGDGILLFLTPQVN